MENDDQNGMGSVDELPRELLNDRNRALTDKIRRVDEHLATVDSQIDDLETRVDVMKDHITNVKHEVTNTQAIVEAKNRELTTEAHLRMLSEREVSRVRKDIEKSDREMSELHDRINSTQNNIFRANERLDQFRLQMNWNQEELEQWAIAEKQKDDDQLALDKFHRADESKVHELSLQLEKYQRELIHKRELLEREITETQAAQIELDKTAEDFKELHAERQRLLEQWEEAVKTMQHRDEEIDEASNEFAERKRALSEKKGRVLEKQSFLEIEQANNRELEVKISATERQLSKLRIQYGGMAKMIQDQEDEVEVMKNTLSKTTSELHDAKIRMESLQLTIEEKQQKLEKCVQMNASTKTSLEEHRGLQGDLEKEAKDVENILKQTQQRLRQVERELADLKDLQYKRSSGLHALRQEEASLLAEIAGCKSQNKNMMSKLHQLDADSFKQQELLYNIEFQIQQMERKVNRAEGERSEEEKIILNQKIEELQVVLDDVSRKCKMLDGQVKRVQSDVRKTKVIETTKEKERETARERIMSIRLENETCQLELSELEKMKENLMVDHDVLKLQVEKLHSMLNMRVDQVYGLENRKVQLELSMRERQEEIAVFQETLRAELRMLEEEKSKLVREYKERNSQVDKLRNRYEILMTRLNAAISGSDDSSIGDDDSSGEAAQAKFIIRAAKEREDLQKIGDDLDAKIQVLLKEERAMRKTLGLLRQKNIDYSKSFNKANEGSVDAEHMHELEEKLHRARASLQRMRTEMLELEDINDKLMNDLQTLENSEKAELMHDIENSRTQRNSLVLEVNEQTEKLEKYERMWHAQSNSLREAQEVGPEDSTPEELDIQIQDARDRTRESLNLLFQLGRTDASLRHLIESLCEANGFQRPRSSLADRPSSGMSSSSLQSAGSARERSSRDGRVVSSTSMSLDL